MRNKRTNIMENGITLVALVVTIIVLLILAGVTIRLVLGENGIIQKTRDSSTVWKNSEEKEENDFEKMSDDIAKLTNRLTEKEVESVNKNKELQEINYKPAISNKEIIIPGANNGGVEDQTFTQSNLGVQELKWYVLSADENGVNLVSETTSTSKYVQFTGFSGYDNCLYYLDKISKNLFNNDSLGVTAERVHALKLSDLKYASEELNGSGWDFTTSFIGGATNTGPVTELCGNKTYTDTRYCKYPLLYGNSTGDVVIDNDMYDEEIYVQGVPIENDTSTTANSLKINSTSRWYTNNTTCKNNLSDFGTSGIGEELFDSSGSKYWIATRAIWAGGTYACYGLHDVRSGCFNAYNFITSGGTREIQNLTMRCVVSIPASIVNISEDGKVYLITE